MPPQSKVIYRFDVISVKILTALYGNWNTSPKIPMQLYETSKRSTCFSITTKLKNQNIPEHSLSDILNSLIKVRIQEQSHISMEN